MNRVRHTAEMMDRQYVPAARVANDVERSALSTRLSALYYSFISDEGRLARYRENIAKVQENLKVATDLANEQNISWLRDNARKATEAATEYDKQSINLVAAIATMRREEDTSLVNSKNFMDACRTYIKAKETRIEELAKLSDTKVADILALNKQIEIVNAIIDEGNAIIIGTWYAIANRSPEHFLQTQKRFAVVDSHLKALSELTQDPKDLELIRQNADAGKADSMMGESKKVVGDGAKAVDQVAKAIAEIKQSAGQTAKIIKTFVGIEESSAKVATLVSEIAAASKEQAQGIEQVNTGVAEMDKVVQQNAANAEESASASEVLSSQAEELKAMVEQLLVMVGGSARGQQFGAHPAVRPAARPSAKHHLAATPSARPSARKSPTAKAPARQIAARSARAEEVIPLDDDDLSQF